MKHVLYLVGFAVLAAVLVVGCQDEEVTGTTEGGSGRITLLAGTGTLLADGISSTTLTATVTDDSGGPVSQGTTVEFTTNLGAIEAVTPTSAAGVATARLRSVQLRTGLARVIASVGDVRTTADVNFVSEGAHHIEFVGLDHASIGVRGAASPQSARLTFEVRDGNAIPVDASHPATVNFTIVPTDGATDATLATASAATNDQGQVLAVVRSGETSGTVEVSASIGGAIASDPIRVAIHGDLPDPEHFSIAFERVNIAGLVYYGLRDAVTARVADHHGNPVPDSTAVWFSCEYGIVQGSAFTENHGEATVQHVTAGPPPAIPGGDGLVTITAQTVSTGGEYITTSGRVMWSGSTMLEILDPAPGFDVADGGAITIYFRVHDANDNPLVGGTTIRAQATAGQLGGDNDVTLPDTQSPAYTYFSVTLSDDTPGDTDPVRAVTVTIAVQSQNGNARRSVTGTID